MSYQTFAQIYDAIMDETLYERWGNFVDQVLQNKKQTVLELACGTGALAIMLKKRGYAVTGLDLSANMLSLANERAWNEGLQLPIIEGDMLDLSEVVTYDEVTCISDCICFMPHNVAFLSI